MAGQIERHEAFADRAFAVGDGQAATGQEAVDQVGLVEGRECNSGWGDYRRWNEATDTCNVQNFLLCIVNP